MSTLEQRIDAVATELSAEISREREAARRCATCRGIVPLRGYFTGTVGGSMTWYCCAACQAEADKGATKAQVGGNHYKDMKIQPIEYIFANGLGYAEGNVVKYVSRWKSKGGVEDLRKARHYIEMLIERAVNATEGA